MGSIEEIPQPDTELAGMIVAAAKLIGATCEWRKFKSNPYPCAIITWKGGEVLVEAAGAKVCVTSTRGERAFYSSAKKLAESIRGRINRELAADARDAHERKERDAHDRAEVEARTALKSELVARLNQEYVDILCDVKSRWDVDSHQAVAWVNVDCGKFSGEKLTALEAHSFIVALERGGFDLLAMAKAYYKLED